MKDVNSTVTSGPLQTERMADGKRKLLRILDMQIGEDLLSIENGFETDYSSIPWFGRFVVRWSKVDVAGVVHDWLYINGMVGDDIISRKFADRIWRITAASGSHRANAVQAWICWMSLRIGGFLAWRRYRKAQISEFT
jgi:Protein of unknown function (DUF1353)